MHRTRICIGLLSALSFAAGAAAASEANHDALAAMSLEELMQVRIERVYGASKYEQKVTRAPASVTIVTADEIARFGHRTLADVLRSIRGLYVSDDRNYSYLGTRGFLRPGDYNTRILVLIDGHRMNDNVYDAAYFARESLLAVDVIERVEFVRGPSSSIYGSSAFFGVVNVVTKQGESMRGTEFAVGAGSLGTYDARVSYGGVMQNGTEVALNASYFSRDGYDELYFPEFDPASSTDPRAANGGVSEGLDGEEAMGLTARARRGGLTASVSILKRDKDVPTAPYGTAFNVPEWTSDYRGYAEIAYEHAFTQDLQLLGRVSYDQYEYYGDYPYDYASPGDPPLYLNWRDEARGVWLSTEWQVRRSLRGGHTLLAGLEYRENLHADQISFLQTDPREYDVANHYESRNAALFAQGEFMLSPKLLLNAGVRYDRYFDSFGSTLNPRVGLIYSPRDGTAVKALYGEAFRAPSAYERFYFPAEGIRLEPERIRTHELVLEQYLGRNDRLSISVYHYDVSELINQVGNDEGDVWYDNIDHVHAHGIEAELERKSDKGTLLRVSYGLQRVEDAATGRTLTNSPKHLAKLAVATPLGRNFDTALQLQYHGPVRTLAGTQAGGFVLGNLTFSTKPLWSGVRFSAGIYNLFDKRYGYPGAEDHIQEVIEQDGRTVQLRATLRF